MEKLLSSLASYDCSSLVLGKTTEIAPFERPAEICKWLKDFKQRFPDHKVDSWIAVDDMPLEAMSPATMAGHCVLTTITHGFLKRHVQVAKNLLSDRDSPVSVRQWRD